MLTAKQRALAFVAVSVLVMGAFAWGIADKEEIKATGQTVLMELAPADPRSLMQGDYMTLDYKSARDIPVPQGTNLIRAGGFGGDINASHRGYAVFAPDAKGVAQFVRVDDETTPLKDGEFKLRFHTRYSRARLVPDSFMFQEGLRSTYQPARYGIFKFDKQGRVLLTGLADENRKELKAETHLRTE